MRKKYIGISVLLVIMLVGFSLPATAGRAKIIPGGPFVPPNQEVNLSAIMTFDEVEAELLKMEKRSKGLLQVDIAEYQTDDYGSGDGYTQDHHGGVEHVGYGQGVQDGGNPNA